MDKLKAFESFVSVATRGSLTAAARAEGVAPAIMGRRLDALEEHLGVKLLVRTTRRISLTHEGSAFLEDCQRLLSDAANAEASVSAGGVKASGHLRITAPAGFGRRHVAPLVPRFLAQHPDVTISLNLSDRVVDLAGEGFDCAVRVGDLPDSSLVSVRIADNRRLCVATPDYLHRHGTPRHPSELAQHDCLTLSSEASQTRGWAFRMPTESGGTEGVYLKPGGPLDCSDGQGLHDWGLAGHGIARGRPRGGGYPPGRAGRWTVRTDRCCTTGAWRAMASPGAAPGRWRAKSPPASSWRCWKTMPHRPTVFTCCFRSASTCRCACACGSSTCGTITNNPNSGKPEPPHDPGSPARLFPPRGHHDHGGLHGQRDRAVPHRMDEPRHRAPAGAARPDLHGVCRLRAVGRAGAHRVGHEGGGLVLGTAAAALQTSAVRGDLAHVAATHARLPALAPQSAGHRRAAARSGNPRSTPLDHDRDPLAGRVVAGGSVPGAGRGDARLKPPGSLPGCRTARP